MSENLENLTPELVKRKRRGAFAEVLFRLSKSPLAMFGLAIILLLIFCALFAEVISPYSPIKQDLMHMFETPSAEHWLGTDEFGRDILSRLIYGARV
ncbi:MAG: ABC transporter permease, partial [Synergistaceae bacterium]|nr:ABC transporter permease [Synergistaceae bacterium]